MCSICNAGTLLASVQARINLTDCYPVVMTGFVNKFVLLLLLSEAYVNSIHASITVPYMYAC